VTPLIVALALAPAADPVPPAEAAHLAKLVRGLMLANLPDPLVQSSRDWGNQRDVFTGLKWHRLKPEAQHGLRNDGHWEKVHLDAIDPAKTLALGIKDLTYPEPGKATFEALIGLDVRATSEQQVWKAGVRLYSGETRVRCRAAVALTCEATNRFDRKPGSLLPDVVLRVRVTKAEIFYTDLVCEHTAGVGGDAAKLLGEAAHRFLTRVKPSFERDLLEKANAAIVKAADTKEVRVAFDKLLEGKAPTVTKPKK
jgi:hypothetical protein